MKFYSEITKELYETEKDLIAAEDAAKAAEAAKTKAAKAKKADAQKVEEAFKKSNEAKRTYNSQVVAARQTYNESVVAAKKAFEETVNEAARAKSVAEENYDKMLKEFISKHPEGYHLTLKDGDNVVTLSSQQEVAHDVLTDYNNLLDYIIKNFK